MSAPFSGRLVGDFDYLGVLHVRRLPVDAELDGLAGELRRFFDVCRKRHPRDVLVDCRLAEDSSLAVVDALPLVDGEAVCVEVLTGRDVGDRVAFSNCLVGVVLAVLV
jgi:hypothetical protein